MPFSRLSFGPRISAAGRQQSDSVYLPIDRRINRRQERADAEFLVEFRRALSAGSQDRSRDCSETARNQNIRGADKDRKGRGRTASADTGANALGRWSMSRSELPMLRLRQRRFSSPATCRTSCEVAILFREKKKKTIYCRPGRNCDELRGATSPA